MCDSAQVGLATGLVSGGIGLGIGAAMSSATTAIGVTSTAAKAAVVVSHAGAYAVGGTVSSMAGCVIDNLASQRKWDEGLGQAAAAGAATGFISGAIAGVGACKEALGSVEKARQAANTTADQIGERAASVQPSSLKALQDAGRAFGESTLTGTVDGLLSAAFDDNVKLGDAVVMGLIGGCVSGAAGAAIAAGRVKWEAHRQSKVVDQLKELEHDHSYLHHSATITEEEQIARITTGLQGSATTETSGVFHDADALKKVTQQSSEAVQKKGLQLCKDVSASKEQLANLTAELKNLQATTDQIQAQLKGNLPKEQRQALGKRLSELKTQRAALYPQIETAQAGANLGIVKDRVVIGQPKGGGSWGTSLKNDNGVIKELPNCQAAAINAKYELHEVAGKVEVKSTKIVSVFPVAAPGQEHMARGLKLKPLSTAKYQVAVRQAARDIIQVQAGNMPAGWETAVTSDGERYYFNRKLGLTQWDHPYL